MIDALVKLYERERIAGRGVPFGYERKAIDFVIELASDGSVVSVSGAAKPRERPQSNVPRWPGRSGKLTGDDLKCAFLCDKSDYVLRLDPEKGAAWIRFDQEHLGDATDDGLKALLAFCKRPLAGDDIRSIPEGKTIAFTYEGRWLHDRPAARDAWAKIVPSDGKEGLCLVTGKVGPIEDLHPRVTVGGSMAALVSYNEKSLEHYGHEKGANSPISRDAAHAYVAALDGLVSGGHSVTLDDDVAIYWSEAADDATEEADHILAAILGGTAGPDAKAETAKVRDAVAQLAKGKPVSGLMPSTPYHVLIIEPGTGRHAVRQHMTGTLGDLSRNVSAHFQAMHLGQEDFAASIWEIGRATLRLGDRKAKPPPSLTNDLTRAVLTGSPYPTSLAHGVLTRLRAGDDISQLHAGILKAYAIRNAKETIDVICDPDHPSVAYHLGRLLAAYESIQLAAQPKVGVTVRERHYRTLSMRPALALGAMAQASTYHLSALRRAGKGGLAAYLDRIVAEIMTKVTSIPTTLSTSEQALLSVGYYQQHAADEAAKRKPKSETEVEIETKEAI